MDAGFYKRIKELGGGFLVGGENYGQGSSREHAALAPMYLGVKAILAKSYARIHRSNLINFGILPLTFKDPDEFERVQQGDQLRIKGIRERLKGNGFLKVENVTKERVFEVSDGLNQREKEVLLSGGLLNYTRDRKAHGAY
jgi:aconitate hydratase